MEHIQFEVRGAFVPRVVQKEILAVSEGSCSTLPTGLDEELELGALFGEFLRELEAIFSCEIRLRKKLVEVFARFEAAL